MNIIVLGILHELSVWRFAMNHATSHGYRGSEHMIEKLLLAGLAHSVDTPFRERQVDGLCEIERCG